MDSLSAESQGKPENTGVGSPRIPSPADLPHPGIEPGSPELQADSLPTELSGKPHITCHENLNLNSKILAHVNKGGK